MTQTKHQVLRQKFPGCNLSLEIRYKRVGSKDQPASTLATQYFPSASVHSIYATHIEVVVESWKQPNDNIQGVSFIQCRTPAVANC